MSKKTGNIIVDKSEEIYSNVVKFILATNYYYTIIDGIKETNFYRQSLKLHVNKTEEILDGIQRSKAMREFYHIADEELYLANLDLHKLFFELVASLPATEVENIMIEIVKKYRKNGNDLRAEICEKISS